MKIFYLFLVSLALTPILSTNATAICVVGLQKSVLNLTCSTGVIGNIIFASYGNATSGSCPNYVAGACQYSTTSAIVASSCLGMSNCSFIVNGTTFGGSTCNNASLTVAYVCLGKNINVCT